MRVDCYVGGSTPRLSEPKPCAWPKVLHSLFSVVILLRSFFSLG